MKKSVLAFGIFVLSMLSFPFQFAQATLQSNLVDPGMRLRNWGFLHTSPSLYFDPTCRESSSNEPIWRINTLDVAGTACTPNGPASAVWSTTTSGGQAVTLTLDNSKNDANLRCTQDRNWIGVQPHYFPGFGYKQLYYYPNLSKFIVRAKINNDALTTACTTGSCNPVCFSDPARYNPQGNGWVNLIIGLPMYDETNNRNLWLELVVYDAGPGWFNNSVGGAPYNPLDPNYVNNNYYYGNSSVWEFYRIYVTHAYVDDRAWLTPGNEHFYNIDLLSIVNTIKNTGGWQSNIDWSQVRVGDAYVGVELFGDAKARFTVSDFDVLFEEKPTDTYQPAGWFDGARPDVLCAVRGWTCDQDKFSEPLEIELYEGATKLSTPLPVIADSGFEAPALCGNTSLHRFSYTFPAGHPIRNNGAHAITAKAVGIGVGTDGSVVQTTSVVLPLSYNETNVITCPILPTPTPPPIPGDLDNDRKVNVTDLFSSLTQSPLSIFTYTLVVGNFGKTQ